MVTKTPTETLQLTTQPAQRRQYAKLSEAAEYLGVTHRTIRQMIADGRITGYRCNSRFIRVDLNEIDAAMAPFGAAVS